MTTRAVQFSEILSGLKDPSTDNYLSGGSVEFYEAGTSNTKNVWTEKEKTNAYSSYTLDSNGAAQLYGEGIYKIIIKNSVGTVIDTWDNYKIKYPTHNVVSVSTSTYTHKTSDDVLLVDTSSGNITINFSAAASWERPLLVKNLGANDVVHDGNGAELIKWSGNGSGATTYTNDVQYLALNFVSDGTSIHMTGDTATTLDGLTATVTELNYNDITTLGTSEDSKVVTQAADGTIVIGETDGDQTIDVASHDLDDGGLKLAGTLVTASATELNSLDNTQRPLLGSTTAGIVLRSLRLYIQDGTNASTLKCQTGGGVNWNGDSIGITDNITKDNTTGNFTLNASGAMLIIEDDGLTGNIQGILCSSLITNATTTTLNAHVTYGGDEIQVSLLNTSGSSYDITSLVDTGNIYIDIVYVTDA